MKQYLEALKHCFDNGIDVNSRAGKVRKAFGYQIKSHQNFPLREWFPKLYG